MLSKRTQPLARDAMAYVLAGGRGSRLKELTDFRAKPAVAAAAHARIDHNDLDALLFVQGYARSEFAS